MIQQIFWLFFVYWLALSFRSHKNYFITYFLTFISILTLLLTQSASNIIAGLVGLFIILFVYKRNIFSLNNILKSLILIIPLGIWVYNKYGESIKLLLIWFERVSPEKGNWSGMTYYGQSDFFSNLFSFLFGYGNILKISEVGYYAEQAFIKAIFGYGIFHATIFFLLLSAPVIIYLLNRNRLDKMEVFPYVIAVFVGFLSLWHYGSVLRTTNIFVFFALYGQFTRIYVSRSMHYISHTNTITKGIT